MSQVKSTAYAFLLGSVVFIIFLTVAAATYMKYDYSESYQP